MFLYLRSQPPTQASHALQLLIVSGLRSTRIPNYEPCHDVPLTCHGLISRTAKIKFKRKGGGIRTFNNWNNPHIYKFGYGHPTLQLQPGTYRHRHKRYLSQHCIVGTYSHGLRPTNALYAKRVKAFNCYTLRGIRPSRYWLLKRKGKESKYAHLKSKIF